MMRLLFFIIFFIPIALQAQTNHKAWKTDFDQFRQGMLRRYTEHRQRVLDNYADYLQQTWQRFEAFKGEKLPFDHSPKPHEAPQAPTTPATPAPLPTPTIPKEDSSPQPTIPQPPAPTTPPRPTEPAPTTPSPASQPTLPTQHFTFYGAQLTAPKAEFALLGSMDEHNIAQAWRTMQKADANQQVVENLMQLARQLGLNDWLTIEMVRTYVDALLPTPTQSTTRIVMQQFILSHMGWDVRLARTNKQLVLLVPTQQTFYNQSYLEFKGQQFYIFKDNLNPIDENSTQYASYQLPSGGDAGRIVNLIFNNKGGLQLRSGQTIERHLTDGRLNISVTIDKGMMEALRHYPPMDIPHYAQSVVLPTLQANLWQQLRSQLTGRTEHDVVKALLHFAQYAFDYATDGDQHGYEKPYFIEENFYYPKNDCEDRAIFLARAVSELLGLKVHLVQFPGHECTAIHFNDPSISGTGYNYNTLQYIICDPTYIGADIGNCMPNYINVKPLIQPWQ